MPITMMSLRAALFGTTVALLCAAPSPLFAQPAQPAQPPAQEDPKTAKAMQLFVEGREAMKKGDYARGLDLLTKSQEIHPSAGTVLNVAACEEQLGKTASAWQHFSLVMGQLPDGDDRLPIAKDGVARLAPRVPYLRVERAAGAPQDMKIRRGDSLIGVTSLGVDYPLDPGAYVVTTEAPNHEPQRYEVKLTEGQRSSLVVDAGKETGTKVVSAPITSPPQKPSPLRPVAFVLGGAGIAGLGVGAVTGILAIVKKSDLQKACPNPAKCTPAGLGIEGTGKALAGVSTASFILGLVGVGAGTVLYFTTRDKPVEGKAQTANAALVPAVLPGGAGMVASGRF